MRKGPDITGTVQMWVTPDDGASVLAFFEERLSAAGFRIGSRGSGVAGERVSYSRGRDRVLISTEYIPRQDDLDFNGRIPYGFQGKGNRFIAQIDGETFFFVVTVRGAAPP